MLRNYLIIAYKVLLRQKFFTFVSLFGISITLTILIVVTAMCDLMLWPGEQGSKLDRALFVERLTLIGKRGHMETLPSRHFLDRYVHSMMTPEVVAFHSMNSSTVVYVGSRKVELELKYTNAAFWDIVEFSFVEGAPYSKDAVENVDAVAVISGRTRSEVFGKEPAVGKYLETTSGTFRIVGVVPREDMLGLVAYADIWVPITQSQSAMTRDEPYGPYYAIVLPPKGANPDDIKREFEERIVAAGIDRAGRFDSVGCFMGTQLEIIANDIGGPKAGGSTLFIAASVALMILFMLLPAMNLVNMNVSRIFERSSEIGVRKAFGASVATLVGQFVVENIVLTLIGGVIAVILSLLALDALNDSGMMPFAHFSMNLRVLIYSLIICVFFGVFSGVLPAYRMSRLHPVEALRGVEL
jgi:putative ABC transport system permease protein